MVEAAPGGLLSNLQSVFMGSVEVGNGRWSVIGDLVYLNMGNTRSRVTSITGPGGRVSVPVDARAETDLEGGVLTVAAGYRIGAGDQVADAIIGLRHARVKSSLAWDLTATVGALARTGSSEISERFTDVIVGVRGRAPFAGSWFVPYHLDVGTGTSRLTWQAMAGVGYRFGWGEASLVYRQMGYEFRSDSTISNIRFSGPALGASFVF